MREAVTKPPGSRSQPRISVIIPVWRDLAALGALMPVLLEHPAVHEVIVAVADASPSALAEIEEMGARGISAGAPNRGRQMDAGASAATGEWLLFQHADTDLTPAHLDALAALRCPRGGRRVLPEIR